MKVFTILIALLSVTQISFSAESGKHADDGTNPRACVLKAFKTQVVKLSELKSETGIKANKLEELIEEKSSSPVAALVLHQQYAKYGILFHVYNQQFHHIVLMKREFQGDESVDPFKFLAEKKNEKNDFIKKWQTKLKKLPEDANDFENIGKRREISLGIEGMQSVVKFIEKQFTDCDI